MPGNEVVGLVTDIKLAMLADIYLWPILQKNINDTDEYELWGAKGDGLHSNLRVVKNRAELV